MPEILTFVQILSQIANFKLLKLRFPSNGNISVNITKGVMLPHTAEGG